MRNKKEKTIINCNSYFVYLWLIRKFVQVIISLISGQIHAWAQPQKKCTHQKKSQGKKQMHRPQRSRKLKYKERSNLLDYVSGKYQIGMSKNKTVKYNEGPIKKQSNQRKKGNQECRTRMVQSSVIHLIKQLNQ